MRTTAILNLKGGVAKTTTAINMGAVLARDHGKKVLLIDADSQCNLTEFFGASPASGTVATLLRMPKSTNMDFLIQHTSVPGLDIVPAEDGLMDLDLTAVGTGKADAAALRTALEKVQLRYDYCIIDCPPAFNAASAAALVAATDVLIPIKLDAFSLRGMDNLMRQVRNMRKINTGLRLAGLLPTMYYKSGKVQEAKELLAASDFRIFPAIRRSDKVDQMTYDQEPLCICSPKSAGAVDYRRFVNAYLGEAI